ncbi:cytoplasmic protein [Pseudohyphozyma bogoriensis]|nr:cytoplasmic protein [Pseudohyphozyma bogoriensis]
MNVPSVIDLSGKLVLVTGGGRGLGVDIARGLAEAGANLALTYNATPADKLAADLSKEFGVKVGSYKMAAESSSEIDAAVALISKEMGEIDVVIANAGICIHEDAATMTDKQFEDVFRVNTFSPYYLSRAAYKSWFPSGAPTTKEGKKDKIILFVSSISAIISNTPQNQCSYNAAKAALTHLGKSLAGEWATSGVRVNILSPGYIGTEMSVGAHGASGWLNTWMERTPMARFANPKEIADMLVVMSSDKTTFMTGSDVVVDGGYTIF